MCACCEPNDAWNLLFQASGFGGVGVALAVLGAPVAHEPFDGLDGDDIELGVRGGEIVLDLARVDVGRLKDQA